jgi:hypothetical protein
LEGLLSDRLQRPVVLVDEDAFGDGAHPFRDVGALASYVARKASETK